MSGGVCVLYVCSLLRVSVSVCVRITGFSWLLNGIPAADTPRAKLWRRLCGLVSVFWQQFLQPQSSAVGHSNTAVMLLFTTF